MPRWENKVSGTHYARRQTDTLNQTEYGRKTIFKEKETNCV